MSGSPGPGLAFCSVVATAIAICAIAALWTATYAEGASVAEGTAQVASYVLLAFGSLAGGGLAAAAVYQLVLRSRLRVATLWIALACVPVLLLSATQALGLLIFVGWM